MLSADNDMTMGQSFTISTEKRADGQFEAFTRNAPELGRTVGASAGEATKWMSDRINQYAMDGYRVKKATR